MRNESGFTVIELLVAMVIMLVSLMALLQSVDIALEHNLKNQMRGEAVRVAEEAMSNMRNRAFDTVTESTTEVPTRLRNLNKKYAVKTSIIDIPNPTSTIVSRKYQVDVKWAYKNVSTTHSIVSVRSRQQ